MANIGAELNRIMAAIYGEEVRGSIHDSIEKINQEVESNTETSDDAVAIANSAKTMAVNAVATANSAKTMAVNADIKSDGAVIAANNASNVANEIDGKATAALNAANAAKAEVDNFSTNNLMRVLTNLYDAQDQIITDSENDPILTHVRFVIV